MDGRLTININDQEVQLRFGYPCFRMYTDACVINKDYANISDGSGAAKLIEAAYRNECLLKEIPPVHNYGFFYDWVESKINEDKDREIADIINLWASCTTTKKILQKMEDEKKSPLTIAV